MMFIKLTLANDDRHNGKPVFIKRDLIVSIYFNEWLNCTVLTTSIEGEFEVKETPEQIMEMINEDSLY